jgi:hypothetical protein
LEIVCSRKLPSVGFEDNLREDFVRIIIMEWEEAEPHECRTEVHDPL